jgi:Ca2+-transporting ATPase
VIKALLGDWVDAGVIFGVVLINAFIGFIQEEKATAAIAALADTLVADATVARAGQRIVIPATDIVPGDLVVLTAGDKVPADLRLLAARDLEIDESALTGESVAVEKVAPGFEDHSTVLAERANMAYASTLVTRGEGSGVVIAIGDDTEVGRISTLLGEVETTDTPLTQKMARFSTIILWAILGLSAVTIGVGMLRGESVGDMFSAVVALAVGAIPEGLPAAVTITLAIGVSRMARRQAIIRKLPAVETLGSTTTICSDKTGTLTANQMTVQVVVAGSAAYDVTGLATTRTEMSCRGPITPRATSARHWRSASWPGRCATTVTSLPITANGPRPGTRPTWRCWWRP